MSNYPIIRTILSWALTPFYLAIFATILITFDILQRLAWLFGYNAHVAVYNCMNFLLVNNFRLMGTRIAIRGIPKLDRTRPVIVVSNHQSMYDIPLLIWAFRRNHPKFISKIELSKWLPGISFPLRTLGSVLIDRKNPAQAIPAIKEFGEFIAQRKFTACIFPEGTRARTGVMRPFKSSGFKALLECMPNALIIPVAIQGSWELVRYKLLPVPFGVSLALTAFPPIDGNAGTAEEICARCEQQISGALAY